MEVMESRDPPKHRSKMVEPPFPVVPLPELRAYRNPNYCTHLEAPSFCPFRVTEMAEYRNPNYCTHLEVLPFCPSRLLELNEYRNPKYCTLLEAPPFCPITEEYRMCPPPSPLKDGICPIIEEDRICSPSSLPPKEDRMCPTVVENRMCSPPPTIEKGMCPTIKDYQMCPIIEENGTCPPPPTMKERMCPIIEENGTCSPPPPAMEDRICPPPMEDGTCPIIEEDGMCPIIGDERMCPIIDENRTCPLPPTAEERMCPIIEENGICPPTAMEDRMCRPPPMEDGMCPIIEENGVCPIIEDDRMCPIIEENRTCPPPPTMEERMCPITEENGFCPPTTMEDSMCPIIDENGMCHTIEENGSCPSLPIEDRMRPIIEENGMCPTTMEEKMCPISKERYRACSLCCAPSEKPGICTFQMTLKLPKDFYNSSTQCPVTHMAPEGLPDVCGVPAEVFQLPVFGACLIIMVVMALLCMRFKRKRLRLPPGPFSWPMLGCFPFLGAFPHRYFYQLSNKYGPIIYLHIGSVPTVVVSSATMATDVLKTHDLVFASRPTTLAGIYTSYEGMGLAWAPYGPHFKEMKKLCSLGLFSANALARFGHIRKAEVGAILRLIWYALYDEEEVVDVSRHIRALSNNIMSGLTLGRRYYGKGTEGRLETFEFRLMMNEMCRFRGMFSAGDFAPFLRWTDLLGHERRLQKLKQRLDLFLEEAIEDHIKRQAVESGERDLLDVLLSVAETSKSLSLDKIKGLLLDLLASGTDAMAASIEWAMAELLKNPNTLKKAHEELDRVVGRERKVEESDIPQLSYLRAIVKETLRLHPPWPLAMPHKSTTACKIGGYDIPPDTYVLVNLWGTGRDKCVWEGNPLEFSPERFDIASEIDLHGQHFMLIPFGSGTRLCPGMPLALIVVHYALASLLHSFEWSLPIDPKRKKPKNLDMEESYDLALSRANALVAVPKARLRPQLFSLDLKIRG